LGTGYSVPYSGFLDSRNSHEVIKLLKKKCEFTLLGNHDLYSIRKIPKNKAGFSYPKNWYSLDFMTRQKLSKNKIYLYEHHTLSPMITEEDKQFMQKLPEYIIKEHNGLKVLFSHFAFPDLTGNTKFDPSKPEELKEHFMFMKKHGCTLGISGHDHFGGIKLFTEDEVHDIHFDRTIKLTDKLTWLHIPAVVNSKFANGFVIFDTDKMEIKAVPLKTKRHIDPKWEKL